MKKKWYQKYDFDAFIYLLPATVIILTFHLCPMFYSFYLSFFKWDLIGTAKFVGFKNYLKIFANEEFRLSMINTLYFVAISVPAGIGCSLFIALLLNEKIKGLSVYRTIYFIPVITSLNAVAIVWNWLYDRQYGLFNYFLNTLGFESCGWIQDPKFAMLSIILMSVWKGLGYNVIIFLAGLQNIPQTLYEAAEIDGAGLWHRFRHITWPLLTPVTFFVLVMSIISSFQVFAQVYMMTPNGGPAGSTRVVVFYIFEEAFKKFHFGYASALAFVLFLIILSMTLFNKLVIEKKVHYN